MASSAKNARRRARRSIPLVTTDLVLRRFGLGWIGELQDQLLAAAAERETRPSPDTTLA